MTQNVRRKIALTALLAATFLFAATPVVARLAGEAEWGFQSYDAEVNTEKSSGTTFKHQYSLLYSKNGLLEQGRLGKYQYDIGYEWAQFISKVSTPGADQSLSETSGHLLYSGQIDLRPTRFPLRLKAYSRDLSRIGFNDSGPFLNTGDDIFAPQITGSLMSGTHIRNGATLVLGLTKDAAVPIFRDYPKLILDFRQNYDRDTKDISPIHTQSDILMMTLTKGDVGLYYLRSEFKDKLNNLSTLDSEYTLGTIGERGSRKWVDLSNWIRVSADATFFERKDSFSGETTNEYDINVYGMASRNKWDLVTLNNFNRLSNPSGGITQSMTIPVYLKGIWDAETDWQLRFTANDYSSVYSNATSSGNASRTNLLATLQVNALKRSIFTVSPFLSVEASETEKEKTSIFTANVETASTRRFSEKYALFGGYNVSLTTTDTVDSQHYEFIRNSLSGRGVYRVSDKLRLELEERLILGSGTTTTDNAYRYGVSTGNAPQVANGTAFQRDEVTSSYYQSITKLRASWVPAPRLRIGLELSEDVLHQENGGTDTLSTAVGNVQYDLPSFTVGSSARLAKRTLGTLEATEISGTGHARYSPDQKLSAELNCNYSFQEDSESTSYSNIELVQRFRYSFFKPVGHMRKLLDVREELSYIKVTSGSLSSMANIHSSQKRLTVGADYYMTKNWILYAAVRYSLLDPGSEKELMGNTGLTMAYGKIQGNIEFGYGKRNGNDDNRVEKRFAANLRKQF